MKISKFAEKYNISIDTIRYYMKIGIITPIKNGGQYHFNTNCENTIKEIKILKEFGFSLSDINTIIFFNKLNPLNSNYQNSYLLECYQKRNEEISEEIDLLVKKQKELCNRINEIIKTSNNEKQKFGLPITFIPHLICPKCKSQLKANSSQLYNNQIINGTLDCCCTNSISIVDGIILGSDIKDDINNPIVFDIQDYLKNTSGKYFNELYKSFEWQKEYFKNENLNEKIILELGTGVGLFLRNIYSLLTGSSLYIATDYYYSKVKYIKEILEYHEETCSILFFAGNINELPVKPEKIDIVCDLLGSATDLDYQKESTLSKLLSKYTNINSFYYCTYIYDKFDSDSYIPLENRKYYNKIYVDNILRSSDINIESNISSNYLSQGGTYEDASQEKDLVYTYSVYGTCK